MATRINIKSLQSMKQQQVSIEEEKQGQKLSVFKFENVDKFNDVDKTKLIEEFKKEQQMIKDKAKDEYERDL